jgi:SAM-dependent methyltransferase
MGLTREVSSPETDHTGLPQAACCLCGHSDHRRLFRVAEFEIVRCRGCGLVYLTPQVPAESLAEVYQESYWSSPSAKQRGYTDYLGDEALYRRTFRRRLEHHVLPYVERGRLLDVGCAAGFFVDEAARAGFDAEGVDVSRPMVDFARRSLQLERIALGTLEDCRFVDQSFDVITLWDVVEHVPDPPGFLQEVRRVLSDDGYLILETQNVQSAFARLTGRRWHHYKVPEHLFHFAPATCTRLLEEAGFEVVGWTARHAGKYVPWSFIVERSGRISRVLPRLLAPLGALRSSIYVNVLDEMVFVARAKGCCGAASRTGADSPSVAESQPNESRRVETAV